MGWNGPTMQPKAATLCRRLEKAARMAAIFLVLLKTAGLKLGFAC